MVHHFDKVKLSRQEYRDIFNNLDMGNFAINHQENGVFIVRNETQETVLLHFYPGMDDVEGSFCNEDDTYYQNGPIEDSELKDFEDMTGTMVLINPMQVQLFLNEVIRMQKEYYAEEKENEEDGQTIH